MAPPIESLPAELLDVITEQLDHADLALLIQCSKQLHHRIEPLLYASQAALDKAMFWGCKNGKLSTIHLAVSYGADVSIVYVRRRKRIGYYYLPLLPDKFPVLTLHLAARNHHVDAFKLLLELGAQIDGNVDACQLKHLMRRLSINNVLLDHLLKAGLGPQVRERPNLSISLLSVIQFRGSVDVVRQLLDNGANPLVDQHKGGGVFTPLTAAIGVNSAPLFELFIEKGADIHGENLAEVSNPLKPLHIPVFAAARATAEHGVEMMQRCLDLGVDINHRYHRRVHARANRLAPNTPLLVYLDSIDHWKSPMKLRPVDGLAYLLTNHAALWHPPVHIDGIKFESPPPLEFLLDKWGLGRLASPEFFAAASFLVKNEASKYHTRRILNKCNNHYHGYYSSTTIPDIVRAWRRFVDLILEYREEPVTIDDLLIHFIREMEQLGYLEQCTVNASSTLAPTSMRDPKQAVLQFCTTWLIRQSLSIRGWVSDPRSRLELYFRASLFSLSRVQTPPLSPRVAQQLIF
jgi:hypothetical protein